MRGSQYVATDIETLAPAPCRHLASDRVKFYCVLKAVRPLQVFDQSEARCIFCHEGEKGSLARSARHRVVRVRTCARGKDNLSSGNTCWQQYLETALRLGTCADVFNKQSAAVPATVYLPARAIPAHEKLPGQRSVGW